MQSSFLHAEIDTQTVLVVRLRCFTARHILGDSHNAKKVSNNRAQFALKHSQPALH